jgi:hypothetical protein
MGFLWGNLREREHFEDLGISGRVMLKLTVRKMDGRVCVIDLVQGKGNWWAVLNMVMSLRFLRGM